MSDDEEIVHKGNVLYSYLADQGYSDFETFVPICTQSEKLIENNIIDLLHDKTSDGPSKAELYHETYSPPVEISSNDQYKLSCILNSRLLFEEDVDVINAVALDLCIPAKRANDWSYVSIGMASLLTSAIVFKQKSRLNIYVSFGIMLPFIAYSSWQCSKKYMAICENKSLTSHLSTLQKLCSTVHKIFRNLKETEILSSGQISIANVGSAMYIPINEMNELDTLPLWKTLPQLRRYLVDALIEMLNTLSDANHSVSQILPSWFNDCGHISLEDVLKFTDTMVKTDKCITLKDIQILNDVYLISQSEYLKWVALCLSPAVWRNSAMHKNTAKRKAFEIISKVQSKLSEVSFTLIMQYNIHNILCTTSKRKQNKSLKRIKEINLIQIDVHNVFLLILSLLLRVRCLEDYLENLSDEDEQQRTFIETFTKEMVTLKDDFMCAERCFENIIHHALNKKNNKKDFDNSLISDDNNIGNTELKPKETGIVVGASDFNINSADEVFLAISGMNTKECETYLDDWCIEKKPEVPKNLLLELSRTLKSRKKEFIERERAALEKQGIQDIQHQEHYESDEEKEEGKECHVHVKTKRNRALSIDSNTSESGTEGSQGGRKMSVRKCKSNKKHIGLSRKCSDSEESTDYDDGHPITKFRPINDATVDSSIISNSSIANIIAMKSQLWGKTTEELFSDG